MSDASDHGFSIGASISSGPGGIDVGGDVCYTGSDGSTSGCVGGSTDGGGTVGISFDIKF